ncbi:MAG: hypothetical protein IPP94_00400 [Ignavibacteria bacterium]|nr:hypothetical protein [Ignavibacteria bacterium]
MTSRQRFLAALDGSLPDRLPVTTHHLMPSFLDDVLGGETADGFFDRFGLDPVTWPAAFLPDPARGQYADPAHLPGAGEARRILSDEWIIRQEEIDDPAYRTVRYSFHTPGKTLRMTLQSDRHTSWVSERLVKEKSDIEVIARHAPAIACDIREINARADAFGERGLVRGAGLSFEVYGQPGCWQDAAVLYGIEELIFATFDDPDWVRAFLSILQQRKRAYIESLAGARYDLIELGGGDASSTVISPRIFEEFVAPFDAPLIDAAHAAGQRVVYHLCGGIMPVLDAVAAMRPDAIETFTPEAMGGDADLAEAKRRLAGAVCMIGGFDQFHFFRGCAPRSTRDEVRRCFAEAGEGGRYILCPSDHFFDASPELLEAYADEARRCRYA